MSDIASSFHTIARTFSSKSPILDGRLRVLIVAETGYGGIRFRVT